MAKTSEVPVLIVGGGAVGCVLSMELARRGVEFRCIDRMPAPAGESRAIALHARTIELIERVDKRLSQRCLDRNLWHKGYVMHFVRDGERSEVRPGLDYTPVQSRYNCIMAHNQSETEGFIRDFSSSEFGAAIQYNTRFVGLDQDGDEVRARVVHADRGDSEEVIRCRYLVAGDGINSRVRQGLGFSLREKDYKGSFFQNLDIFLNGFDDWTDHFHYCVGTDHFLMVAALPGGHFRLLLSDRGEAADPDLTPQQAFGRLLDQHYDGITFGDVVWHSKWETWERLADTFRLGNVFLAGDAAHVHSTTGGQGMNCCMQDAFNLGWKLALVVKGQAKPALLDTYEAERRPVAEQVIWAASSLHDIFMAHGKSIAAREKAMFEPGYTETGRQHVFGRRLHLQGLRREGGRGGRHGRSRHRRPCAGRRLRRRRRALGLLPSPGLHAADHGRAAITAPQSVASASASARSSASRRCRGLPRCPRSMGRRTAGCI